MAKLSRFSISAAGASAPPFGRKGGARPRLSIHRSSQHIYAQVIDDAAGLHRRFGLDAGKGRPRDDRRDQVAAAAAVGKRLAERAKAAGVSQVVFDRGGFLFHGRVKALADAAREGGLEF